ncbi:MAG: NAD(+)/NADH kinase [Defluviitaleaceae bacterium]|nr:NAD(+)/NADH kinase [Defluviitaleaceae bacterium]MCL2274329.1 NAD(+)/NADH kinase [Defluviitaleaceae bacterium]
MIFSFYTNELKDPDRYYEARFRAFVESEGHKCVSVGIVGARGFVQPDICVVLGGDGTMLKIAPQVARHGLPLLGINLGNVGYFTDVEKDAGEQALKDVIAGNYTRRKHMMLAVKNSEVKVLNDIVVKNVGMELVRFTLQANDKPLADFRADGIIFATPAGSTAYNRAAGGALLLPESRLFTCTPICANDPSTRPWVFEGDCTITLCADKEVTVYLDGAGTFMSLLPGVPLHICRADVFAITLKTGSCPA